MPDRTSFLLAMAFTAATASSTLARAEEYITVNGLPCGEFCRMWMGIKLPSENPPHKAESPAPRIHEQRSEEEGEPRPAARRQAGVAHHAVKPAKVAHTSAPAIGHAAPEVAQTPRAATPVQPPAAEIASPAHSVTPSPVATPVVVETKAAPAEPEATPTVAATPQPTPSATSVEVAPASTPQAPASLDKTPEAVAASPQPAPSVAGADDALGAVKTPSPSQDAQTKDAAAPTPAATSEAAKTPPAAERPDAPGAKGAAPEVATAAAGKSADDGRQILIVLTKAEVKDVADLHDKSVVLAGVASISDARLKAAFAAAGANGAQFSRGAVNDVDEVENGQVAAAIVAVVKPEVAGAFPEVPGYRVLRVEIAPEASR